MKLTQKQAEQILATIEKIIEKVVPNASHCNTLVSMWVGKEEREWEESYIEIIDFEKDGSIAFDVYHYAENFPTIVSVIDRVMKEHELSYAVTYRTVEVDYRKNTSEEK